MSTKVYVGGLAWATSDEELQESFQSFGEITEAVVIKDRDTGRSRGFGFVTFADPDGATKAIAEMNGATLAGRTIRVDRAEDTRRDRGGPGGGGGGGGGARRGGGGGGGGGRPPRDY
ncbi:MAG: RNA-binding protein [Proteobacteria bacterium]|nr:RNA-binding protein [Pseudomonadota bacterium]